MLRSVTTLGLCLLLAPANLLVASVPDGEVAWEPLDEDMDIMALIDDEPQASISLMQQDTRLQAAAAAGCQDDPSNCPEDFRLTPKGEAEGTMLIQVNAKYKFQQPVQRGGI
eukprot:TRINITY_DN94747_c0_g1_i1.p1 TRINITY_DN94747_c0_g1~~TRINITY_DN94747_c0_g1_i1.p1  ORF type:complete len:112 (+),score=24.26 TRINITY_DN94747_c0_g1_i1:168-503(+)